MKYANLILDTKQNMINIGDQMQIFAIENLYRYMGINYEDVVRIKVSDLSDYFGEKLILPINYPMFGIYKISEDIIPIYLGISIMTGLSADGLKCKENEPIGCRDVYTYNEMIKYGIKAYCSSCFTLTFDRVERKEMKEKIFFVDVPENIMEFVPTKYHNRIKFETQIYYNENCPTEKDVRDQYKKYCDEGFLVVTSKIHCALPCLAAGIPVIFVCEKISFRYSVLNGIIPIYTPEKFHEINWEPESIDLEERKNLYLEYATLRVKCAYEQKIINESEHDYYQKKLNKLNYIKIDEYKNVTVEMFKRYLENRHSSEDYFEYVLWGVTQITQLTYEMISIYFPNSKLVGVIDMYKKIEFQKMESKNISYLEKCNNAIVFVTAGAANPIAENIFKTYNINNYCICYNGLHVEDGVRIKIDGKL